MGWLKRAQDACPAGGVSWGYRARKERHSSSALGWQPPYPETTGYIIETFLDHARSAPESDSRERARRMADWESRVQLPDGGIQGGVYGAQPVASSTFVTGQVLFGWVRAFEEFGEPLHRDSALRAGDFLLSCLDDTGRFARGYSLFCASGPKAYEARTGWALARLGQLTGEGRFSEAADRMARYALSCRHANGWFDQNDLNYHDQPLTHTIAYVLEGLWGTGNLLGRTQYQDAVRETLGRLGTLVRKDGFLAGRWRSSWEPAVPWSCLTGSAQIAGVALRVHGVDSSSETLDIAGRLLGFVAATQLRDDWPSGFRGGIHGSLPLRRRIRKVVRPELGDEILRGLRDALAGARARRRRDHGSAARGPRWEYGVIPRASRSRRTRSRSRQSSRRVSASPTRPWRRRPSLWR